MAPTLSKLRPVSVGVSVAVLGVFSLLLYKYFQGKDKDESEDNELTGLNILFALKSGCFALYPWPTC